MEFWWRQINLIVSIAFAIAMHFSFDLSNPLTQGLKRNDAFVLESCLMVRDFLLSLFCVKQKTQSNYFMYVYISLVYLKAPYTV